MSEICYISFSALQILPIYLGKVEIHLAILSVIDLGSDSSTGTGMFITDYPLRIALPAFLIK
jgi:hypothetical protein